MMTDSKKKKEYQRLEFLGDRVLNLMVSHYLYRNYPEWSEGELTNQLRFTSNENLGKIIDHFSEDFQKELIAFKHEYLPNKPGLSADDIEALIGKYYLEKGLKASTDYFLKIFSKEIDAFNPDTDYISIFQIYIQKEKKIVPYYKEVNETLDKNNQHTFEFEVFVGENRYGYGKGSTKSNAIKQAALDALIKLNLI